MSAHEARSVLGDVGARAGRQNRDLLLYLLDVVFAGLEVDLTGLETVIGQSATVIRTCLTATTSPVAFSIALYTTPKLPPVGQRALQ